MQQSQTIFQCLIPPSPHTERGMASFIDVQGTTLLYFNGPTIVARNINNFNDVKTYQHKSDVKAAKISYDGKLIASIDEKGTLLIHQIGPKQFFQLKKYQNFFLGAKSIDFTADRKRICVVGHSKNLFGRVGSIDTGTNVGEITGVSSNLSSCCFRPLKYNKLVVGGDQFNVKLYEGPPYKFAKSVNSHSNFINQIKYNSTGSTLVSVGSDRKIVLYEGDKLQILKQKTDAHMGSIFGVDWMNQNNFITVSADKTIKLWNIELEQIYIINTCSQQKLKNPKAIQYFQVAVKHHSNKIYSLSLNGSITIYNNPLTQISAQQKQVLIGIKSKPLKIMKIDQTNFVVLDNSGKILHINSQNLKTSQVFDSVCRKTIIDGFWDQQKQFLVVLWGDTSISTFKWQNKSNIFSQIFQIKENNAKFICQSSTFDLVGASNSHIFTFQKQAQTKKQNIEEDPSCLTQFHNQKHSMIGLGTVKGSIFIYDSKNLQLMSKVKIGVNKITSLRFISKQIPVFLCGDSLGHLKAWRVNQLNKLQQISESVGNHGSVITSIKCLENKIYTSGMDNKIFIWNVDEKYTKYQRVYQQNNAHHLGVFDLEILNQKRIVTIGGDFLIKFWKV